MKINKTILIWMAVGGSIGSYIPFLWGEIASISFSGLIFSSIGSILGIVYGYRKTHPKENSVYGATDPDDDII